MSHKLNNNYIQARGADDVYTLAYKEINVAVIGALLAPLTTADVDCNYTGQQQSPAAHATLQLLSFIVGYHSIGVL